MNLRWSWHPETRELFASMDPELWASCAGDPVRLLGELAPERIAQLAEDRRFLRRLGDAVDDLHEYLSKDLWYQSLDPATVPRAIGYFSMEYGITEVLPQYSGGLGILAGDHLKTASDVGAPIIGVGLLYKSGYFVQSLSREGWQQEHYPALDPNGLPISRVTAPDGSPLRVGVGLPGGRWLRAQVWKAQVGRVPLLLLDSDVEENEPGLRHVTDKLYGGSTEHRLHQEMLLGIGGTRAIREYCAVSGHAEPEVYHCNEGHAGFLGVERIREYVQPAPHGAGLSWDEAVTAVRAGTVFTTHTPVPAGIDRFPKDLIASHFGGDNGSEGVPVEKVLELGAEDDPSMFNMAHMGLRLAQRCNGVAKLHGVVSREMFSGLWPGFDTEEVPITSVTNGVHAPTWVSPAVMELASREATPDLATKAKGWEELDKLSDESIWSTRRALRAGLVEEVRRRVRASWIERGMPAAELDWIANLFDPDVLTIGFARRVPSYKRLTLMLWDEERFKSLLLDSDRPIQMVVAGKSHPADDGGKALVQKMVRFADAPDVRHRIAFLPNYDMAMARFLYTGCDVWLNNPLRPLEACGTSGMKSALNGGLNLSIRDGWWDEMSDGENGWDIPSADDSLDGVIGDERRDSVEAKGLYELLESAVTTRFYDGRTKDGVPRRWVAMVRHTLRSLGPQVLASRMVRDYVVGLYGPAAVSVRTVSAEHFAAAKTLAAWRSRVTEAWPAVRVAHVESVGVGDTPEVGEKIEVHALVELGSLSEQDVSVEAVYGPVDGSDEIKVVGRLPLVSVPDDASSGSAHPYRAELALERSGSFGYTVRVLPRHPLLANQAELGLITTA
jgi:starch phosphorylase